MIREELRGLWGATGQQSPSNLARNVETRCSPTTRKRADKADRSSGLVIDLPPQDPQPSPAASVPPRCSSSPGGPNTPIKVSAYDTRGKERERETLTSSYNLSYLSATMAWFFHFSLLLLFCSHTCTRRHMLKLGH